MNLFKAPTNNRKPLYLLIDRPGAILNQVVYQAF